jgi:hypothetical protein
MRTINLSQIQHLYVPQSCQTSQGLRPESWSRCATASIKNPFTMSKKRAIRAIYRCFHSGTVVFIPGEILVKPARQLSVAKP